MCSTTPSMNDAVLFQRTINKSVSAVSELHSILSKFASADNDSGSSFSDLNDLAITSTMQH